MNGAKHSDKNDDSRTVGGESEIKSVMPSATNEKGNGNSLMRIFIVQ